MKQVLFSFLFIGFAMIGSAQGNFPDKKFIEVIGSAEKDVIADKFVVSLSIREYYKTDNSQEKVAIELIEQQLIETLHKLGISSEDIKMAGIGDYWREEKDKDYLISKNVNITFGEMEIFNNLLKEINTQGIHYMRIIDLSNKDILEHRKEVRIKALHAAKEKATYLLESLGKELGDVISITEYNAHGYAVAESKAMSNVMLSGDYANVGSIENLKKIKLRYDISAKFEIK